MAIGYVYLMTNGKDYKIGLTASTPEDRMKQLQTGSSEQINLVAYTICMDMNTLESNLHTQFASKRKAGEWFALSEDNLHHIYSIFKQQSINIDMSCIPEIVSKDIDELMRIDGKRLARGENTLYDKKYDHIPNYKHMVLDYMHEEEKDIERKRKEEEEARKNEREKRVRLEELLMEDAQRIFNGEKPLHTFEYKELIDWKDELEDAIQQLRWEKEEQEREQEREREREREIKRRKAEIERRKAEKEKELERRKAEKEKERAKIEAEKGLNIYEINTAAYNAKKAEREAGKTRRPYSWVNYLDESKKHLFKKEFEAWENERKKKLVKTNREKDEGLVLKDPKVQRDRIIYIITVLEREKNRIKPPKYEPYFQGSFTNHLADNRQKAKKLIPRANRIDTEVKYLAGAIGEDGMRQANLLRDKAMKEYDKYVLKHKKMPSDYIG